MGPAWPRPGPACPGSGAGHRDAMKTSTRLAACPQIEWSQWRSKTLGSLGRRGNEELLINLLWTGQR